MIGLTSNVRVFAYTQPTDMHLGFDAFFACIRNERLKSMCDELNLNTLRLAMLLKEKVGKQGEKVDRAQRELFIKSIETPNGERNV